MKNKKINWNEKTFRTLKTKEWNQGIDKDNYKIRNEGTKVLNFISLQPEKRNLTSIGIKKNRKGVGREWKARGQFENIKKDIWNPEVSHVNWENWLATREKSRNRETYKNRNK